MDDEAGDMRMGRKVSLPAEDVKTGMYLSMMLLAASNCHRSRAFRTKNSGLEISMQERTSMASGCYTPKRQVIDPTAVMSSHGHWLRQIILYRIRIIHGNVGRVVHWWGFACSMSTNHLSELEAPRPCQSRSLAP
jgi:hypothetical protein